MTIIELIEKLTQIAENPTTSNPAPNVYARIDRDGFFIHDLSINQDGDVHLKLKYEGSE